jgi:hypothetical protein
MERTSSSHCVNGEFPPSNTSAQREEMLLIQLCLFYIGEDKILLPGQAAWETAGEQLMISLTTGAGAVHFILISPG